MKKVIDWFKNLSLKWKLTLILFSFVFTIAILDSLNPYFCGPDSTIDFCEENPDFLVDLSGGKIVLFIGGLFFIIVGFLGDFLGFDIIDFLNSNIWIVVVFLLTVLFYFCLLFSCFFEWLINKLKIKINFYIYFGLICLYFIFNYLIAQLIKL